MRAAGCFALAMFALTSANAQSTGTLFPKLEIHRGLVTGAIVGAAGVVGLGIAFIVLHNRGVIVGCIAESGGKKTLVGSGQKVYALLDTSATLPVGERVKLKGHKSGRSSAPTLQVEKVLKDYGPCHP
jgi:hypothetical protein